MHGEDVGLWANTAEREGASPSDLVLSLHAPSNETWLASRSLLNLVLHHIWPEGFVSSSSPPF